MQMPVWPLRQIPEAIHSSNESLKLYIFNGYVTFLYPKGQGSKGQDQSSYLQLAGFV